MYFLRQQMKRCSYDILLLLCSLIDLPSEVKRSVKLIELEIEQIFLNYEINTEPLSCAI